MFGNLYMFLFYIIVKANLLETTTVLVATTKNQHVASTTHLIFVPQNSDIFSNGNSLYTILWQRAFLNNNEQSKKSKQLNLLEHKKSMQKDKELLESNIFQHNNNTENKISSNKMQMNNTSLILSNTINMFLSVFEKIKYFYLTNNINLFAEPNTDEVYQQRARKTSKLHKKFKKMLLPLLIAYKLKFITLIPVLIGGLTLLVGTTGLAGFFFALFMAVISHKLSADSNSQVLVKHDY